MEANLIVDSCVDFNEDTENIPRVPFRIIIDEEEIVDENTDILELIRKMKKSRNQIKTACAPPEDFINKIKKQAVQKPLSPFSASFFTLSILKNLSESTPIISAISSTECLYAIRCSCEFISVPK